MLLSVIGTFLTMASVVGRQSCPQQDQCSSSDATIWPVTNVINKGYFYLGGIFSIHGTSNDAYECGPIREVGIQNLEMFLWAIRTHLRRYDVNSQIDIGGIAFDSCSREEQTIEKLMTFEKCSAAYYQRSNLTERVDPRFVLAYIGPDRDGEALAAAELLRDMKKVQISHAATAAALSDKSKYKYFLRTIQSNQHEVNAILSVMNKMDFRFVIVVSSRDLYGKELLRVFRRAVSNYDVCIVLEEVLPRDFSDAAAYDGIVERLLEYKSVYALAVLASENYAAAFFQHIEKANEKGAFAIFGLNSWGGKEHVIEKANGAADGAITISAAPNNLVQEVHLSQFKKYYSSLNPINNNYNIWFNEYWESLFKCDLGAQIKYNKKCNLTNQVNLNNAPGGIEFDPLLKNTLLAVDSALFGIFSAIRERCSSDNVCPNFLNPPNLVDQIYKPLINVRVNGDQVFDPSTGEIARWKYEILNIVEGKHTLVGEYTNASGIDLQVDRMQNSQGQLYRKSLTKSVCPLNKQCCGQIATTLPPVSSTQRTKPTQPHPNSAYFDNETGITGMRRTQKRNDDYKTRFSLNQNWIIPLGVLAGLGIVIVVVLELYIMCKVVPGRQTQKLRSVMLGQLLLFGIFLSYLTLFAYIPEPTDATCTITRLGVGLSYALCFSVLLVKLMIINSSSRNDMYDMPHSGNYQSGSYQFLMFFFAFGVQVVIDVQWLITVPPQAVKVTTFNKEDVWVCNHYTWLPAYGYMDMSTFLRSEFENHVISLVYIMFLIVVTSVIALISHNNTTNHRESVFIAISSGFSIPIWIAWILIAGLNRDHAFAHQYGDACIAFGLFITATLILLGMFLPKIHYLKNNKHLTDPYITDDVDTMYNGNGSMYGGILPSYHSKPGPGSIVYVNDQGIYSEPIIPALDPRANHLKYPKSNSSTYSVHSMPTYFHRPESVYTTDGGTLRMLAVTPDLTGRHRKAMSEFGGNKSNISYKTSTLKRARSTQDIGSL